VRKEKVTLANFVKYCEGKDLPFWEAVCAWSGAGYVKLVSYDVHDESQNPAKSRTGDTLANFVKYCEGKDLPFWEAVRAWSGAREVLLSNGSGMLQNPCDRNFRPKEWRCTIKARR
jgi:hypothetical protein